ncbi:MAG TPA: CpsD/CapB family tyrosine-protein kinase [Methylomirabilota bacterium]|jgi:capsular exopolysaccharide synthesis family protein
MPFRRERRQPSTALTPSDDGIRLAARLQAELGEDHRTLLFTGTAPGDGVTTVARRVAVALAQMNEGEVLLVDAAVRDPAIHEAFGLEPLPGLADVITRKATLEAAVHVSEFPGLSILVAGHSAVDGVSLFTSSGYADFVHEIRRAFRFVVFDSSAIMQCPETALIAARMDGVVLVVAAGRRTRAEIRQAREYLEGLRVNLLGIVLSQGRAAGEPRALAV